MKFNPLQAWAILAVLGTLSVPLQGQDIIPQNNQGVTPREESDTLPTLSIEAPAFTEAFTESNRLIIESGKKNYSEETIRLYMEEVDTLFAVINHLLGDSTVIARNGISLRELDVSNQQVRYYLEELKQLQKRLSNETTELNQVTQVLIDNRQEWERILASDLTEEIPEERMARIYRTTHRLDSVKGLLHEDHLKILEQEDRLTDKINDVEQLEVWIMDQRSLIGERFFSKEFPGFFEDRISPADTALVRKHIAQIQKSLKSDMEIVKSNFRKQMSVIAIFLVLFMVFAIWFRKNHNRLISERFSLSEFQKVLIHSPVVTVLFLVGLLIRFSLPHLPHTFRSLNLMIMMIPMLIIVIRFFGARIRNWILLLSVLCGLTFFYELTYNPDILLRTVILAFSLSGLSLFLWILIKRPYSEEYKTRFIYRLLNVMFLIFVILLSIAVIANLVGAFSAAEFFTLLPIQVALLAVGVEVATSISDTIIYLLLASKPMQKVNIIRDDFEYIYKKSVMLVNLLLWGLFFVITLNIFRIKDVVFDWGEGLFTDGIKVGAVEITLGNILIFLVVSWLSIVIARMIRHILEKDVFPRVKTAKGVPSTVVLLVRIILISGGFFLAAAAAGIKLTNLSIVLGAFSVGIGFGLQNIFNNMVSGLILALEHPINVGDVVQVGELIGMVRSIGLRSSTVKSFDGAEVIVPNGNLISKEMINWTLSDSNRRMDISIGVAYGSDTDKVIKLMQEVAMAHQLVDKNPPPTAYFTGFGDSALNFRLLAWTKIDHLLAVESDLNGTINKTFKKAGIEIPFPQHDLHVRSDDTKGQLQK